MNKFFNIVFIILFATLSHAVEMGVPIQLKLKDPSGVYPDASGVNFSVRILTPSNGCVLREETFSNQTVVSGTISLALGTGSRAGDDPNLTLTQVYDNATNKSGLDCVDINNNSTLTNQTYIPAATDTRVIRVSTTDLGVPIIVDFIQRATPYAIHAESVGGKVAADILVQNGATSLSQSNLEDIFANATKFNKLKNIADNGIADNAVTATTATNATNFTGSLTGDVTGTMSATVVGKLNGVTLAATAPTSGQVLAYNGAQYVPMTISVSAPVTSVNGQTGAVVLNAGTIGAVTSATSLLGDVTGNVSATVVSNVGGKTAAAVATAVTDVNSATTMPTASTIARRDASGSLTAINLLATNNSTQNIYLFEGSNTNSIRLKAPNSFADYMLVLPTTDGSNGEVLQTDGNGNLSWIPGAGSATSASIIAALGYTPADNAVVLTKSNNLGDLVSATVARTNLGLTAAATMNVGTTVGTLAAGDDSRITGALQQTAFNAYVAPASCTAGQSMYWNSVSSEFTCQNILVSGDISGIASNATVTKVQGIGVSFAALANNHIMQYNGSNFVNRAIPTCGVGEYLTFNGTAWSCSIDLGGAGVITSISVTAPLSSTGGTTPTLSIALANGSTNGYLSSSDWTTFNNKVSATSAAVIAALGYTPADNAASGSFAIKANNLSDLASATVARTNLGLGAAAILNVGTAPGTVAAGDDTRLANALQTSTSFSGDVTGTYNSIALVTSGVTSGTYTKVSVNAKGIITSGTSLTSSDVTTALGFTPADGADSLSETSFNAYVAGASCTAGQSMYWNSVSSLFACQNISVSGDISGIASSVTVTKVQGVGVSITAIANNHMLQYNGTNLVNRAIPTCSANQYLTFNGTAWSCANDAGASGIVTNVSSANAYISVATSSTTPVLTLNVGTSAGTVAAGNDSRIANALQTTTVFVGDVSGTYNTITLNNSTVVAGTYPKVTVNAKGIVTSASALSATDIPVLDAAKITTGQLPITLGGTGAATSATALSNIGAARRGANDDITSFVNSLIFSSNAAVYGNLSVSGTSSLVGNVTMSASASVVGNLSVGNDISVVGVVSGTAKYAVIQKAPDTGGTTTAYTLSFGAAADAKITAHSIGDSVKFKINAVNTGAATLKVANGPAASLISAFTGAALGAGDLQVGYAEATYDGTNWIVEIAPRRVAVTGLNLTGDSVQTLAATGVRAGDSVSCSVTQGGTLNSTNNWVYSVMPTTDAIRVVMDENGTAGAVTGITCFVKK